MPVGAQAAPPHGYGHTSVLGSVRTLPGTYRKCLLLVCTTIIVVIIILPYYDKSLFLHGHRKKMLTHLALLRMVGVNGSGEFLRIGWPGTCRGFSMHLALPPFSNGMHVHPSALHTGPVPVLLTGLRLLRTVNHDPHIRVGRALHCISEARKEEGRRAQKEPCKHCNS
jgi:hypothetical protein